MLDPTVLPHKNGLEPRPKADAFFTVHETHNITQHAMPPPVQHVCSPLSLLASGIPINAHPLCQCFLRHDCERKNQRDPAASMGKLVVVQYRCCSRCSTDLLFVFKFNTGADALGAWHLLTSHWWARHHRVEIKSCDRFISSPWLHSNEKINKLDELLGIDIPWCLTNQHIAWQYDETHTLLVEGKQESDPKESTHTTWWALHIALLWYQSDFQFETHTHALLTSNLAANGSNQLLIK